MLTTLEHRAAHLIEHLLRGNASGLLRVMLAALFLALIIRGWFRHELLARQGAGDLTVFAVVVGTALLALLFVHLSLGNSANRPLAALALLLVGVFCVLYSGYDNLYYALPIASLFVFHTFSRRVAAVSLAGIFALSLYVASFGVGDAGGAFHRAVNVVAMGLLSTIYIGLFGLLYHLILRHMADRRALAGALAQLEERRAGELRQLALEERTHLSRELHDSLGHHLTATRINAQIARKLAQRTAPDEGGLLRALDETAEHSLSAVRKLQEVVSALGAHAPNSTLFGALRESADTWPSAVELDLQGDESRLPAAHRLVLFRAFQEALTNAYKHAYGETVHVAVHIGPGQVALSAWNHKPQTKADEEPEALGNGSGLRGLQGRARKLGGTLRATQDHHRFFAELILPLEAS